MADNSTPADLSEAADDLSDISAGDWATAAETMAQEAAEADDEAADDGGNADESDDTGEGDGIGDTDEPVNFADAFSPVAKDEPEPADRDGRYRARLRDSEAENERLRDTIAALQAAEVNRLAAAKLADPDDLFRDGAALADLCDDDGRVDPSKVDAAVNGVLAAHPHWRQPLAPVRGPLLSGATSVKLEPPSKSFVDAFAPAKAE